MVYYSCMVKYIKYKGTAVGRTVFFLIILALFSTQIFAAGYVCEVITVGGLATVSNADQMKRPLKEGDILKGGDVLETASGAWVDLAFDPALHNVTRIGGDSILKIIKVHPGRLNLDKGNILARFDALPKNSKFQIVAPTAVAAARGTVFKVSYTPALGSQIVNLSKSKVEVYRASPEGLSSGKSLFLNYGQSAQFSREIFPGQEDAPVTVSGAEFKEVKKVLEEVEARVKDLRDLGRTSQVPQPPDMGLAVSDDENWRVTYLRRSELEGATSFDPSTGLADVVEANTELAPNQMFCLEDGTGAELMNTKTGEHYFVAGPFAGPVRDVPGAAEGKKSNYSNTSVLALEGSVQTDTYMLGGEGEEPVKVSELLLEAGKPFSKSGGPVNESKVTPCGYVKKVKNPCQEKTYEFLWAKGKIASPVYDKSDPLPIFLPKPTKRGSLEGQEAEETDV